MPALRFFSFVLMAALAYAVLAYGEAGSPAAPITVIESPAVPPAMVIGFVGGFVKHDAAAHSTVQVVEHLRNEYPAGVYVQAFENRRQGKAYKEILRQLDLNNDGALSNDEKRKARIIIFGHSWGASETVTLARKLEKDGIPVLLTIQVDSVSKIGQNDRVIPTNVGQAVNFYQPDGIVHGQSAIRAADPAKTEIMGNFRFDYKANPIRCEGYPWFDRVLVKAHTEIECDPKVWNQVEALIYSKLAPEKRDTAAHNPALKPQLF
ncbi:MAG TPA: hypothetical protein VHS34_20375 [Terriglobales bacterium]|jgi:hypothetical protein|nr:hypothetical protein [Terriglobales bacterium]